jgi:hypothetical protein
MKTEDMILADEFCVHHHIDLTFLYSLRESGLIEIIQREEKVFIPIEQLGYLEKLVRFYTEMDINLQGIEAINHLLHRINEMQQQITMLTNKLNIYDKE